jgi:hypothetical protein
MRLKIGRDEAGERHISDLGGLNGLICRRAEICIIRVGDGLHGHDFSNWRWMLITEFTDRMVE